MAGVPKDYSSVVENLLMQPKLTYSLVKNALVDAQERQKENAPEKEVEQVKALKAHIKALQARGTENSNKGKGKDGFIYRSQIGPNLMQQISCSCGIMTKLCQSLEHLQVAWNSRPNKKVKLTFFACRIFY